MFLLIREGQVLVRNDELNLKNMQNLVGKEGDSASIEFVYNCFSDKSVDLVCDDEFLYKGFNPNCFPQSNHKMILCGNVLVVGHRNGETIGLTEFQIQMVINQLFIVTGKIENHLFVTPASHVYQSNQGSMS